MNKKTLTMAVVITLPALFTIACGSHETREVSEEKFEQTIHSQPEEVVTGDEVAMPAEELIDSVVAETAMPESEMTSQLSVSMEEKSMTQPSELVFYFDTNKSAVKQSDFELLISHAEYLVKHPEIKVKLIGHTDQSGNQEYNQWLAKKRSDSVAQVLIQYGVPTNQISMESQGENLSVSGLEHALFDRRVEVEYSEDTQLSER